MADWNWLLAHWAACCGFIVLEEPDAVPPFADAFVPPAAGCPAPDALVLPELAGVEELAELPDPPEGGVMPAAARAWAWPEA